MQDARRAKQKGYITLKEAATVSGYSADYVGQLIRGGKIKGEQVYSSVAWVTTKEEVMRYANQQKGVGKSSADSRLHTVTVSNWRRQLFIALAILVLLPLVGAAYIAVSENQVFAATTAEYLSYEYK